MTKSRIEKVSNAYLTASQLYRHDNTYTVVLKAKLCQVILDKELVNFNLIRQTFIHNLGSYYYFFIYVCLIYTWDPSFLLHGHCLKHNINSHARFWSEDPHPTTRRSAPNHPSFSTPENHYLPVWSAISLWEFYLCRPMDKLETKKRADCWPRHSQRVRI